MADGILISELYGKPIISNSGSILGSVQDLIIDFDEGKVSSMLLVKSEELIRSDRTSREFAKSNVRYDRVRNVAETIIVSADIPK